MNIVATADWGPLVIGTDVDEALIAKLKEWLPTYLRRATEERGLSYALAEPKTFTNVLDGDEWMDHQLPAVLVTTAETDKVKGGPNFNYEAAWLVNVSCVVRGRKAVETRFNAAILEGCVRRAMTQKARTNTGPLNDVKWIKTRLSPVSGTSGSGRYLAAGLATYNVATDHAVQGFGGPDIPNAEPYLDPAKVTEVTTTIEPKS